MQHFSHLRKGKGRSEIISSFLVTAYELSDYETKNNRSSMSKISFVLHKCGNTFVVIRFCLVEVRLNDGELLIVTKTIDLLKRGVTGVRGDGVTRTRMCTSSMQNFFFPVGNE